MKFNVQLHEHDLHQVMDQNLGQNNSSQSQANVKIAMRGTNHKDK